MVMVGSIINHDGSQSAGAETVHVLNGKETVIGNVPRFNVELSGCLVKEKLGPAHMTCRPRTNSDQILALWLQGEGLVK